VTATPAEEGHRLAANNPGAAAAAECSFLFVATPEIEMLELGTARDATSMLDEA